MATTNNLYFDSLTRCHEVNLNRLVTATIFTLHADLCIFVIVMWLCSDVFSLSRKKNRNMLIKILENIRITSFLSIMFNGFVFIHQSILVTLKQHCSNHTFNVINLFGSSWNFGNLFANLCANKHVWDKVTATVLRPMHKNKIESIRPNEAKVILVHRKYLLQKI